MFVLAAVAATLLAVVTSPFFRPSGRLPAHLGTVASAVLDVLPGGNCGACGHESCFEAAAAVACGEAPSSVCVTGGIETAEAVASVMRAQRPPRGA